MDATADTIKLFYNTEREKLTMPEYGRNVLKMVEQLKGIGDREKRSEQAAAIVKVMESLNPQVHQQENYLQKLWDHLYLIAGLDLDIDAPYPAPTMEQLSNKPMPIPLKEKPVKAYHYGRNIESIIDLISEEPEGEIKSAMIHSLAIYMRQQYLIWNKDSVSDETIFNDIVKLSDGRIVIPAGMSLTKISDNASFSRPGIMAPQGQQRTGRGNKSGNRFNWKNRKK